MKKIQVKTFNGDKLKIKKISDKKFNKLENIFKKIQKQGKENEKKQELLYIDYFGEMLTLRDAVDRFIKKRCSKT